jgi:hypothetical protein
MEQPLPLAQGVAASLAQAAPEVGESRVKDFIIIFLIIMIVKVLCF